MAVQAFDQLQPAAFAGFEFGVSHLEVIGGLRDHVHEYPHSPGGAPEKLGRKLYEFHYTIPLYQGQPKYPKAFPETMQSLMIVFEGSNTFDLTVPILGTISAYCTSWRIVAEPKTGRNGVTMEATFKEDQSNLFLVTNLVARTTASLSSSLAAFQQALADQQGALAAAQTDGIISPDGLLLTAIPSADVSLFLLVISAAEALLNEISAALDYGAGIVGFAEALVSACQVADANSSYLDLPTAYPLLYAMHDLWRQAQKIAQDALQSGITLVKYTVPQPGQSVTTVSTNIYGDTSHAIELMQMNAGIVDPFFIPGGTVLTAYLFAPTTAAA